jgi:hypothetical protein
MRSSIVSVWHFGQGGRGILWIIMLAFDLAGARHSQSPGNSQWRTVMEQNDLRVPEPLFNIAHLLKYIELIHNQAWPQFVPALGPIPRIVGE